MALFGRKKKIENNQEPVEKKDSFKDEISKAYDEIMANGVNNEKTEENAPQSAPVNGGSYENELFKAKIKEFREKRTQETLLEVLKMLPGRKFFLPSVSNVEKPFEKVGDEFKLKEGAVLNPALLTAKDGKMFLPVFTDEASMTQKSPSGVVLKFPFEQCVSIVYDTKNPVGAVVINPFSENMIIGEDLLRMIFKEQKKEDK